MPVADVSDYISNHTGWFVAALAAAVPCAVVGRSLVTQRRGRKRPKRRQKSRRGPGPRKGWEHRRPRVGVGAPPRLARYAGSAARERDAQGASRPPAQGAARSARSDAQRASRGGRKTQAGTSREARRRGNLRRRPPPGVPPVAPGASSALPVRPRRRPPAHRLARSRTRPAPERQRPPPWRVRLRSRRRASSTCLSSGSRSAVARIRRSGRGRAAPRRRPGRQ